jgi:hypothetical protein
MMKKLIASILLTASVCSFAQSNNTTICSWGVLRDFDKTSAAPRHCEGYAGLNDFGAKNPNRPQWINACMPIVNQAVANCNDTDIACMKAAILPLKPQICSLNQRFQAVK